MATSKNSTVIVIFLTLQYQVEIVLIFRAFHPMFYMLLLPMVYRNLELHTLHTFYLHFYITQYQLMDFREAFEPYHQELANMHTIAQDTKV